MIKTQAHVTGNEIGYITPNPEHKIMTFHMNVMRPTYLKMQRDDPTADRVGWGDTDR